MNPWIDVCRYLLRGLVSCTLLRGASYFQGLILSVFVLGVVSGPALADPARIVEMAPTTATARTGVQTARVAARSEWKPSVLNDVLTLGDRVRTLRRSRATLMLNDQTSTRVDANTTLEM